MPSPSLNRLVTASAPRAVACGTRLVDMTLLQSALGPHLRCPECLMTGGLVIDMCEEVSTGIAGILNLWHVLLFGRSSDAEATSLAERTTTSAFQQCKRHMKPFYKARASHRD